MRSGSRSPTRVRESICAPPIEVPSGRLCVTMSVGVAATSDSNKFDRLLRVADEALYRAKHGGRNRVELEVL